MFLISPMPCCPESDDRRATHPGRWNPKEVWLNGCTGSSTFTHLNLGLRNQSPTVEAVRAAPDSRGAVSAPRVSNRPAMPSSCRTRSGTSALSPLARKISTAPGEAGHSQFVFAWLCQSRSDRFGGSHNISAFELEGAEARLAVRGRSGHGERTSVRGPLRLGRDGRGRVRSGRSRSGGGRILIPRIGRLPPPLFAIGSCKAGS